MAKRYKPRSAFNYRNVAKTGFKVASRFAKNYMRSRTQTRIRPAGRDFGGVTTQHDQRTIYRAKKMPYRKKKKWVAFTKKVKAVEISDRAKSTLLINSSQVLSVPAIAQSWTESHLYSFNSTSVGNRDIAILLEDINTYKKVNSSGDVTLGTNSGIEIINPSDVNQQQSRKEILFSSATLDNTFTNSGPVGIEMDLYTINYPRQSTGTNDSFLGAVDTNNQNVSTINVMVGTVSTPTANIQRGSRGCTLFDMAYGMSRTGAKIIKKEKFFIAPGNSITKNIRDPKNHNYRMDNPDIVFQNKNLTQTLVACYKVVTSPLLENGSMTVKSTRSYKYTYEGGATPYNRYVQESV